MKKIFLSVFLILLFNLCVSGYASDSKKNYLKGKFYESVKGNFLVATEQMRDPRFEKKVIVMLENDETGAWGLVINKPLGSVPLGSLISKSEFTDNKKKELYDVKIPVFWGGPVNENRILVLHSQEYKNKTTKNHFMSGGTYSLGFSEPLPNKNLFISSCKYFLAFGFNIDS